MNTTKKITAIDEYRIIELYQSGKTGSEILAELNYKFKTTKTIYDCLRRFNISTKEKWEYVNCDHFYFSKIDTANKAYILGLMVSDGWVSPERNTVGIQLQEQDEFIVKQIKEEWKTDNKIIDCYKKPFLNKEKNKTYIPQMMKRIAISSQKMVEDLACLGVVARKSRIITLPVIEKDLSGHLFRGIIDGDGSIYMHSNKKNRCIRIVGSHYLVAQCCLYLHLFLGICYHHPSINENISFVDYSSEAEVRTLANFLYKDIDKSFCLERKKVLLEDYLV